MSKPRRNERAAWIAKRIDDAYAAAARGDGWKALSQAWNVTQPCALQWCQEHIPKDVCVLIGKNGYAAREPAVIRQSEFSKPQSERRASTPRAPNEHCRKITYRDGDAYECGRQTENGRNYCTDHARYLITMFDRTAPENKRAAIHPWAEEGAQKANRAKKSA